MKQVYNHIGKVVLRTPLYPLDYAEKALSDSNFFEGLTKSDMFKRAVFFSSPDFYAEMRKYVYGMKTFKNKEKIKLSILKFISRMSTRCTPFGCFASCSVCNIGDYHSVKIGEEITRLFRLDMVCVYALWQYMSSLDDYVLNRNYIQNSSIYKINGKIRYMAFSNSKQIYELKEVKCTKILMYVLEKTKHFVKFSYLVNDVAERFEISETDAECYLRKLIDNKIIFDDLYPSVVGGDYLLNVIGHFSNYSEDIVSRMCFLNECLTKLQITNGFNEDLSICGEFVECLDRIGVKYNKKYLFQLDSFREIKDNSFPKSLIRQLNEYLQLFMRITPTINNYKLESFKNRFVQKYEEQEVLLLEAIDPEIGVGYGLRETLNNPLISDMRLPNKIVKYPQIVVTPLIQMLLNKLAYKKDYAIELTDEDVKDLPKISRLMPTSIAAMFSVIGKSEDGFYKLHGLHFMGSSGVNLISRFAYGSRDMYDMVVDVAEQEQKQNENKIVAEIVHLSGVRTGNVLRRPHIRKFEIDCLSNGCNDGSSTDVIPVDDLTIAVRNNRIVIKSISLGKEVMPRLTTAHNYNNNTTPVYNFLCDMQMQEEQPSLMFSWMGIDEILDMTPRVVYKNVVLSPAKWNISCKELEKINFSECEIWRKDKGLPQEIVVVSGDNRLYVNFKYSDSFLVLKDEAKKRMKLVVEEFLQCRSFVINEKRQDYMNEFIVPLILSDDEK